MNFPVTTTIFPFILVRIKLSFAVKTTTEPLPLLDTFFKLNCFNRIANICNRNARLTLNHQAKNKALA